MAQKPIHGICIALSMFTFSLKINRILSLRSSFDKEENVEYIIIISIQYFPAEQLEAKRVMIFENKGRLTYVECRSVIQIDVRETQGTCK